MCCGLCCTAGTAEGAKGPYRLDLGDVLYAPNVCQDDQVREKGSLLLLSSCDSVCSTAGWHGLLPGHQVSQERGRPPLHAFLLAHCLILGT